MKIKRIIIGITLIALAASFTAGAFASDMVKEITAHINYGLTMKLNNADFNPSENDGAAIRPITYNGRTYLPVRALSEALGIAVDYDGATETVYLGDKEWTHYSTETFKTSFEGGTTKTSFTTDSALLFASGKTFKSGLVMQTDMVGSPGAKIALNNKYQTIRLEVTAELDSPATITIINTDSKTVYKSIDIRNGESAVIEADIAGAAEIKIGGDFGYLNNPSGKIVIGDIQFK